MGRNHQSGPKGSYKGVLEFKGSGVGESWRTRAVHDSKQRTCERRALTNVS